MLMVILCDEDDNAHDKDDNDKYDEDHQSAISDTITCQIMHFIANLRLVQIMGAFK